MDSSALIMTRLLSILLALLCLSTPARAQQAALPHNPNTGEVPGDLVFTGNNTITQSVTLGTVALEAPSDGIETITINGTAAQIHAAGARIFLHNGNSVGVVEDTGGYYWSDEDAHLVFDRDFTAWSTAEEGAARLRAYLSDWIWYDAEYNPFDPQPVISGTGAQVIITMDNRPALGLSTSNSTLLPYALTQAGNAERWSGTPKFLRLLNPENNKLYELKITGSPNPVLTISEVAP